MPWLRACCACAAMGYLGTELCAACCKKLISSCDYPSDCVKKVLFISAAVYFDVTKVLLDVIKVLFNLKKFFSI